MASISNGFNPFRIPLSFRPLAAALEHVLGLHRLIKGYEKRPPNLSSDAFLAFTLETLGVRVMSDGVDNLQQIPASGPLLVVANHPLGGLEGVAIAKLLMARRPDLKVMTNALLKRIPELSEIFIGVDILPGNGRQQNARGLREAHRHLASGGALLVFPAGMVAAWSPRNRQVEDRPWHRLAGHLARRHKAVCLPVLVGGRNSWLFQTAGLLHPRLRTVLLARELSNKRNTELRLTIGAPIAPVEWQQLADDQAISHYLRLSTDAMRGGSPQRRAYRAAQELDSRVPVNRLREAIVVLEDCRLLQHGEFDVYCAPYHRLGPVIDEIGVVREQSFRAVGEGSGAGRDTDAFDTWYLHLFLWDREAGAIAGGYRVGLVDKIVEQHGIHGLYSRTLYEFGQSFLQQLGMAVEMGRSFIHPDYQRRPTALDLLWRGIGAFIARNPRYHTLFGPVSVSREYSDLARALIADTMMDHYRADNYLLDKVKPVRPFKAIEKRWTADMLAGLANIKVLSKLIGRYDTGKTVPVLLRHYLSLNGRFVCFNVDPQFNYTLAGLIVVDLRATPDKYLTRYLGAEGLQTFKSTQGIQCAV